MPNDNHQFQQQLPRRLIAAAGAVIALIALVAVYGYVTGAPWVGMVEYTYDAAWRVTSSDGYKTFWDWLSLLIVPLVLGFGGSLVAIYATHALEANRERTAWSMRIAEEYLRRFDEHGRVKKYLQHKESEITGAQELNIRAWGNWLEFVALLSNLNMADARLIRELGIDRFIAEFYQDARPIKKLAESWEKDWLHIARFAEARKVSDE